MSNIWKLVFERNVYMFETENETEDLLLSLTKICETLNEPNHTKTTRNIKF